MAEWKTAGKVRMTPKGVYSSSTNYEILDMVTNEEKTKFYIAKQDVTAGTALTNTDYWEVVTDVTDFIEDVNDELEGLEANFAPLYSATSTYAIGDYCMYDGVLYRCTTAITASEAWNASHWIVAPVGDELVAMKAAAQEDVDDLKSQFAKLGLSVVDGKLCITYTVA